MGSPVHVPGYDVDELIGFGGAGEVWRARDLSSGETVAIKRLHARGVNAVQRLRREAAMLAAVAGPHVIGVRAVVVDGDDAVLVLDHAGGGSLATLLAVRGRVEPPELVTVLAPLAAALAAAHSRGLVHGDLTPANILFSGDGRPMLADFGVAHAVGLAPDRVEGTSGYVDPEVIAGAGAGAGARAEVSTASDVYALGAVGYACLAGEPPGVPFRPLAPLAAAAPAGLVEAIESALAPDGLDRPDARSLGDRVLGSCAAAPVVLVGGDVAPVVPVTATVRPPDPSVRAEPEPVVTPSRGDEGWRRVVLVAAVLMVLAVAVGVGELWGRHGQGTAVALPAASPAAAPSASVSVAGPPAWTSVVQRLASARAAAFARADPSLLSTVYVAGAPAYSADSATLRSLAGRGLRARGFAITVEQVQVEQASGAAARLRVVDRLSGYTLVDGSGAARGSGPGAPSRGFTMVLRRTESGWRIAQLTAA